MALFKRHLNSASITTYDAIIKVCINDTIDGNPSYYALQRMATAFKKNKQMDLAIACLRRSNELSDAYDKPPLLEKDYLRLIKFLQQNNENDVAELEFKNICKRHPEFADKRISNLLRINEELKKLDDGNVILYFYQLTRLVLYVLNTIIKNFLLKATNIQDFQQKLLKMEALTKIA